MPTAGVCEGVQVHGRIVGHGMELQVRPDPFRRIQFRRVRREEVRVEVGMSGEKRLHPAGLMGAKPIPEQHDGAGHLAVQFGQEVLDPFRVDVCVRVEAETESNAVPSRRHRKGSDHGDFGVGAGALAQDGRAALRGPGAPEQRRHQHPGFVEEGQMRLQAMAFF
jgi:hypothetical protein